MSLKESALGGKIFERIACSTIIVRHDNQRYLPGGKMSFEYFRRRTREDISLLNLRTIFWISFFKYPET